jgi:hypothetical protein
LIRTKQCGGRQVILQVGVSQLTADFGNCRGCSFQPLRSDAAFSKIALQVALGGNEPLSERDRLGFHGVKQLLDGGALLLAKAQLVGILEHMDRAGVSVQLGRQRGAHAATCGKIGYFLVRQGFDCAAFQARIGSRGLRLRARMHARRHQDQHGEGGSRWVRAHGRSRPVPQAAVSLDRACRI